MRNSKLIFSAAVAISAIVGIGAASAADLPARTYTKAPPMPAMAMYDWSGFYIGINGGYATSDKCWYSVNAALAEGCHSPDGGLVGGQFGYNWQFSNIVVGVEGSGDWANLTAGRASTVVPIVALNSKVDAIYTATARVGGAWNNVLLYVKGGGAWASDKYNETIIPTNTLATIASETRGGYVVGVGGEYGFTPNLSLAVEYDYMGMGTKTLAFVPAPGTAFAGFNERIGQNIQTVTARLNYRFGGPVVAKY
jgi:outer membrane immunogenic protein